MLAQRGTTTRDFGGNRNHRGDLHSAYREQGGLSTRNPPARLAGFSPERRRLPDQSPSLILTLGEIESDAFISRRFASRGHGAAFRCDSLPRLRIALGWALRGMRNKFAQHCRDGDFPAMAVEKPKNVARALANPEYWCYSFFMSSRTATTAAVCCCTAMCCAQMHAGVRKWLS